VLAITQGPSWGWSSARVIVTLVASVLLGTVFLYRCRHHNEPGLDLTLFRARSFSVTNVATLLYSMGFFAMLLGNILFLTSVTMTRALDQPQLGPWVMANTKLARAPEMKMAPR
jgi:hypothetical protein